MAAKCADVRMRETMPNRKRQCYSQQALTKSFRGSRSSKDMDRQVTALADIAEKKLY